MNLNARVIHEVENHLTSLLELLLANVDAWNEADREVRLGVRAAGRVDLFSSGPYPSLLSSSSSSSSLSHAHTPTPSVYVGSGGCAGLADLDVPRDPTVSRRVHARLETTPKAEREVPRSRHTFYVAVKVRACRGVWR